MKKAIVFGAGQIGRGFIGELCFDSGYFIIFVDVSEIIVDLLNQRKKYKICLLGEKKVEKVIENFKCLNLKDEKEVINEIMDTDLIFTSVGANNLFTLSEIISKGIKGKFAKDKGFLNIVICENLLSAGKKFKEDILKKGSFSEEEKKYLEERVGFVETVISRMTSPLTEEEKKESPLLVKVEPYKILPVDKNGFKGNLPEIDGFLPVANLHQYEELKIFGHNLSHVSLAYPGFLKGYTYIWECIKDEEIFNLLKNVQNEVKQALRRKFSFKENELEEYFSDLNKRFDNKLLKDTIFRVGREPLRKLGKEERIIGAINLCLGFNIFPESICFVLASALCYNYSEDKESIKIQNIIKEKGIDFVLKEICGITDERIIEKVKKIYWEIKK
ncbi:MAG: hypothetical protein NC915_00240 [Candidatus Omnitrophica bacterium]|nr:hypothetical protein [Candidatus Omnitrophota bacterium]